jgi:hypothetical protein
MFRRRANAAAHSPVRLACLARGVGTSIVTSCFATAPGIIRSQVRIEVRSGSAPVGIFCLARGNGRDSRPGRAVTGYPRVTSASITSSSAVMTMPLVSGPRKTAMIYTTSEPIVPYIIGLTKPMPWFTAK